MQHLTRIQHAVDYIEAHLASPIRLADVSAAAFSSLSYMHRIFYQLTGHTMKEYIRLRRLSRAATRLLTSTDRVIDIALDSGFDSAESFSRAFKKQYAISPRALRQHPVTLPLLPPYNTSQFTPTALADTDFTLDLSYTTQQATEVIGFLTHTTLENHQQTVDICQFAERTLPRLAHAFDLTQTPVYGVYTNMTDASEFDYTLAGQPHALTHATPQLVRHCLPAGSYATFHLNRNDRIKQAWHYIYGQWFALTTQYRAGGFDYELYYPDHTEIFIPMQL